MEEFRPIEDLKSLIKPGVSKLSKTEYRFVKLLKEIRRPLNEEKIIAFYQSNVQMHAGKFELINGGWIVKDYTSQELKRMALVWFDRNLGAMFRKNILSKKGNYKAIDLLKV